MKCIVIWEELQKLFGAFPVYKDDGSYTLDERKWSGKGIAAMAEQANSKHKNYTCFTKILHKIQVYSKIK